MVKLRGVDLNLLVILDVLLDEAHVGRAAERLALSQPAASNALARARALFADPLLVRAPGGLRRTPRAEALREPLREALGGIGSLLAAGRPDLRTMRGAVRLVASDFPVAMFGPALPRDLAEHAPGIDVLFHPWHAGDELERLERGEVDIAVTTAPPHGAAFRADALGSFGSQIVMRRDHPAADGFDLDRWLAYPHLVISGQGKAHGPVDAALAKLGRARRVAAVVPTFLLALELLAGSDLIAALPVGASSSSAAARLTVRPLPIALEPVTLHLVRHRRSDDDPVLLFVADLIRRTPFEFLIRQAADHGGGDRS